MITGTHLKIPETGDRGSVAHPAISANFEKLDTHNHNGVNSDRIGTENFTKGSRTVVVADWSVHASGDFVTNITLPSGYEFDDTLLKFVIASGPGSGGEVFPTIVKTDINKFNILLAYALDLDVVTC